MGDTVEITIEESPVAVTVAVTDAPLEVAISAVQGIGDAPIDGTLYGRKNGAWNEITGGGGGGGTWGSITGILSNQTDLQSALNAKLSVESDPVFTASEAALFATGDKAKLNGIESGAQVNDPEADPIFGASPAAGITLPDIENWDGKLSVESDPVFLASVAASILLSDITNWNAKQNALGFTPVDSASANWLALTGGGETNLHSHAGGGGGAWGGITGTLSAQTDLQAALDAKQNTLAGTPALLGTANIFTAAQTVSVNPVSENNGAMIISRGFSGAAVSPVITALFRNPGDEAGGGDYQNEVHIRLQAGTTTSHRAYINWANYDGVDKWVMGRNADSVFILYNSETVHRFWIEPTTGAYSSGNTIINAAGTGAVVFGYHDADIVGTGGVQIYGGGAAPQTLVASIDGLGRAGFRSGVNNRYTLALGGTYTEISGSSMGGIFVQPTYSPSENSTEGMYGINLMVIDGSDFNYAYLTGGLFSAYKQRTGTVTTVQGGMFVAEAVAGSGSNLIGGEFQVRYTASSGGFGDAFGIRVDTPIKSGASYISSCYGIRVMDQTAGRDENFGIRVDVSAGANKWGIYAAGAANNWFGGNVMLADTVNIVPATTTGTKIGTSTSQKLGFWNAAPVVQPSGIANADGTLADITTKFNTLISTLETLGLLATV